MKFKNASNEKILWKDNRKIEILGFFGVVGILLILLYGLFFTNDKAVSKFFYFLGFLVFLYLLIAQLRRKLAYITFKGIRIGNVSNRRELLPSQKSMFYEWIDISSLIIIRRWWGTYAGGRTLNYLHLKLKKRRIHECIVNDIKGFLQTLKKLNKGYLLKNKKELYKKYGIE